MLSQFSTLLRLSSKSRTEQPHSYPRIKADREIRLFTFSSITTSDSLHIRIECYALEELPGVNFECISYTWGDPRGKPRSCSCGDQCGRTQVSCSCAVPSGKTEPSHVCGDPNGKIKVYTEGEAIAVTPNLWYALQQIWKRVDIDGKTRRFWADQICIDQKSKKEKREQVPLMSRIFPEANRVICWLGREEEDGSTRTAVEILDAWAMALEDEQLRFRLGSQLSDDLQQKRPDGLAARHALTTFFSRQWFRRAWILQEVFVSHHRAPIVVCGGSEIEWSNLCRAYYTLTTTLPGSLSASILGEDIRFVSTMIEIYTMRDNKRIQLSTLLQQGAERDATDRRDLVYAMLGILRYQGVLYSKPDYDDKIDVGMVFTKYTREMIQQEKSLDILSFKKRLPVDGSTASWVFNPKNMTKLGSRLLLSMQIKQGCGASGNLSPLVVTNKETYADKLELHGRTIDRVAQVVNLVPVMKRLVEPSVRWNEILNEGKRLAQDFQLLGFYHHTGDSAVVAILKTLAVDTFWTEGNLDSETDSSRLYHSFQRMQKSSWTPDRTAEASTANIGWAEDSLFEFAKCNFRFDNICHETADDVRCNRTRIYSAEESQILEAIDGIVTSDFVRGLKYKLEDMKLALTQQGYLGLVPHMAEPGDHVCVLLGGYFPFVLRKRVSSSVYTLLGPAYVHGLMGGVSVREYENKTKASPRTDPTEDMEKFCLI